MNTMMAKVHFLLNDVHGTWHYFNKDITGEREIDNVFLFLLTEGNIVKNDNFKFFEKLFQSHIIVDDIGKYFDTFKLQFQFNDDNEIFIGTVHSIDTSDELEKDEVEYLWIQSLDDEDKFIKWLGDPIIKRQIEEENDFKA